MTINQGILVHHPISTRGGFQRIPQIKHETPPRPHHHLTASYHIPRPAPPPPVAAAGSPPPALLQNPSPHIAVPVPLPPSAAEPETGGVRKIEGVVVVQIDLVDRIEAESAIVVVLVGEVVADELFLRRVESATRRQRDRRKFGI
ncbi:hypothetical protein Acr_04g0007970 [Actinidia rufa]|uniref:Uncharacterized protein n=1 Tax=Actinidia rufa TaxID=165716 RepID=A0A7J0EJE8_9ERIC|nr:hypothetical protein Acr_04g0007970 [Actinidia rufa]